MNMSLIEEIFNIVIWKLSSLTGVLGLPCVQTTCLRGLWLVCLWVARCRCHDQGTQHHSDGDDFHYEYWSVNITQLGECVQLCSLGLLSSWYTIHPELCIILNLHIWPLQMACSPTGCKFYLPITGSRSSTSLLPTIIPKQLHSTLWPPFRSVEFTLHCLPLLHNIPPLFHLWATTSLEVFRDLNCSLAWHLSYFSWCSQKIILYFNQNLLPSQFFYVY